MFPKKSLLLILLAAFALLATPALAEDRVTKLVVRNNLKNGRQFEAVFQPGLYVLHPFTLGFPDAIFELDVISNPSSACFIRGDHNHPDHIGHIDRLLLRPSAAWRYFELQDTCYLRFEIRNYYQGAVNIRQVKKVKTIELTEEWQEVTFGPGRWSGSALHKYFTAEFRYESYSHDCYGTIGDYGFSQSKNSKLGVEVGFMLDKPCTLEMRGYHWTTDDDGNNILVPGPRTATFVKSR